METGALWDRNFIPHAMLRGFEEPTPFDTPPSDGTSWFRGTNTCRQTHTNCSLRTSRSFVLDEEPCNAVYEWVVRFQGGTDGTRFGLVAASYMYKDQTVSVIGNVRDSFGFRSGVAHMQDARLGLRTDNPPPRFKHGQRLVARLECGPGVFSARCDGEEAEGPPECVPLVEQLPRDEGRGRGHE